MDASTLRKKERRTLREERSKGADDANLRVVHHLRPCVIREKTWLRQAARRLLTVTLVRYGQLLATLGAAGSEHAAAISGEHTFTESVLVLSLAIVGLECSFHCVILLFLLSYVA